MSLAAAALLAAGLGGAPDLPAPAVSADARYAQYQQLAEKYAPRELGELEVEIWWEAQCARICYAAEQFIKAFPDDPRRWKAVNDYALYAGKLGKIAQARRERAAAFLAQALMAPDIGDTDRQRAMEHEAAALLNGAPPDMSAVRRSLDELTLRYPQSPALAMDERKYAGMLKTQSPMLARAWLQHLSRSANQEVAALASGQLRVEHMREQPVEMKFRALDGREVDLAASRGKVVLIDFWATWCGPCVAELPNIREMYDRYHTRGFEVIGISHDKSKDKLRSFVADRKLPWPQFFDDAAVNGRNRFAEEYGVVAIPTLLLLDREGRLVSEDVHGAKLGEALRRLFGS